MSENKLYSWYCIYSMKCKQKDCSCYRGKAFVTAYSGTPYCDHYKKRKKFIHEDLFVYQVKKALESK